MPVFLSWLNLKAAEHARAYPEVLKLEDVENIKTFSQFDERVTLPVFGFQTKEVCPFLFSSWRFFSPLVSEIYFDNEIRLSSASFPSK